MSLHCQLYDLWGLFVVDALFPEILERFSDTGKYLFPFKRVHRNRFCRDSSHRVLFGLGFRDSEILFLISNSGAQVMQS